MADNKQDPRAMTTDNLRGGQSAQQQNAQHDQNTRVVTSSDAMALTDEQRQRQEHGQQKVSVRALRTVHKDGNLQGEVAQPGHEFETTRTRAAELRSHGIVEFTSDSDQDEAFKHSHPATAINERVKRDVESRKIPEQHKSSPLRNPELKLAEPEGDVRKEGKR